MINIIEKKQCNGCYACTNICPQNCIAMEYDEEGFLYPKVSLDKCINCGLCEKICPIINKLSIRNNNSVAFACKTKDEQIREMSSSGGIFSVIANYVIDNGGVVFGASFNDDFAVVHKYVEDKSALTDLFGSKYVQSKIGDSYRKAQDFLDAGRWVLFTGTPCQIGGLLSFLKKSYNNLLTQDIICHGVPSPVVWEKYLTFKMQQKQSKIEKITFRSKRNGWKRYSLQFVFENGEIDCKIQGKDPYMKAFFKSVSLRPSCFDCSFKTQARNSDFTLADLWGIETIAPTMDDNKGTSLVVLHSAKALQLFEKLKEYIFVENIDLVLAINSNPCMIRSVKKPKNRIKFLKRVNANNFDKVVSKYCKDSLITKIKRKLKINK